VPISGACAAKAKTIWQIGENDNSANEFALSPDGYEQYIANDFGWEDKFYLIGKSTPKVDWPYIMPGPEDTWGGTWGTSGWRTSTFNILFGIDRLPRSGKWNMIIDILDCNGENLPLLKVKLNGTPTKFKITLINEDTGIKGQVPDSSEYIINIPLTSAQLQEGVNEISLTILEGSWLKFDQLRFEGPGNTTLINYDKIYLREVRVADYELEGGKQPLIVDIEHLEGELQLIIELDGEQIFAETIEIGRYVFEAPMLAVESKRKSSYRILVDSKEIIW